MSVSTRALSATDESPTARRARRPGWRDPRLAIGLALVCASVLLGARLLGRADDTVAVLAAPTSLSAGQRVTPEGLSSVQVRFTSAQDADRYLAAVDGLPADGAVLARDVGAGELLPRAALSSATRSALVELPLAVDSANVPASVAVGSHVDVWVTSSSAEDQPQAGVGEARRVLADVPVITDSSLGAAGAGGTRQVVVGVQRAEQDQLPEVVGALADASVLLVRQPE